MPGHYDVIVLGAGPGGYVAAIRAAQLGKRVAVVEHKYWGGVCLNVGCIPSKALLRNAELAHLVTSQAKTFGIEFSGPVRVDYGAAFARSRTVADGRVKGVHFLMKKNKIDEIDGWGTFADAHTLDIALGAHSTNGSGSGSGNGRTDRITFDDCIIASGASTRLLPGTSLSERVVSYEEQILSSDLPGSIIIAGGGAIGVEFAYVLGNYGVQVTLIEYLDRILPLEDVDVSTELTRRFKRAGIQILTSTRVDSIEDGDGPVKVTVTRDGAAQVLEADKVMQAIGFAPRVSGYGLERTGVQLTDRGAIQIDEFMRTSVPNIYAIGDVTAKLMLAHVAEAMGIIAAETLAGAETMALDYVMMPRATFCQPQVASFGWTEAQARKRGFDVRVAKFPFTANGKAQGLADPVGFVKLISDAKYGELLGGHLIGPEVTELLPELTLAQQWDLTSTELARNVHAHPTLSEAVKEALHGLAGHMINM
jgi:dihydrolipoamide dehydrogenase